MHFFFIVKHIIMFVIVNINIAKKNQGEKMDILGDAIRTVKN